MFVLHSFNQAVEYVFSFIPHNKQTRLKGREHFERSKYLFGLAGNPQNSLKVIHIAGTSGKGSTAYMISALLRAHGFKVGLHVSPHIIDIRERIQLNGRPISKGEFVSNLNELIRYFEAVELESKWGKPGYFEILVLLAFHIFHKKKVDYAVIETGLGGMYDSTNTVQSKNKFVVLTKIGLDHTEILGASYKQIAHKKAMIIKQNSTVVTANARKDVLEVFEKVARENDADIYYVSKKNYEIIQAYPGSLSFNYNDGRTTYRNLQLSLSGNFQVENASLSLRTLLLLSKRDKFPVDETKVRYCFQNLYIPGRFEVMYSKKNTIVLDGAHNPQKIKTFVKSLRILLPDKPYIFLLAFKKGKDVEAMLDIILPYAKKIYVTSFFRQKKEMSHLSADPYAVADLLKLKQYKNFEVIEDNRHALMNALKEKSDTIVITGSLYFISEIFDKRILKNLVA